jgi:hypothetical protein
MSDPDRQYVRRKRELPWCNRDPKRYVELPLGDFVAQPVGSTSYGKGLHIYAHLAGEEEAAPGIYSFAAKIGTDGTVTWVRQQRSYAREHDRADEILAASWDVARAWFERDPKHCASYYHDVAAEELYRWHRDMAAERDTQRHLTKLLADPEAPKTRNQKTAEGEWETVPMTAEERAGRRALWERNFQRAVDKLARLHTEHDARIAQLRSIKTRCLAFLRDDSVQLLPFEAVPTGRVYP